ncbi:hypothetical protein ACQP1P_36335 [Dactylosporangium sp. CA-052675]|uniref:hypothetical protein n=1 Tax=Dactylosporangium sp. CA-052675 TaxID=3239927 RepID=UPI003D8CF03D
MAPFWERTQLWEPTQQLWERTQPVRSGIATAVAAIPGLGAPQRRVMPPFWEPKQPIRAGVAASLAALALIAVLPGRGAEPAQPSPQAQAAQVTTARAEPSKASRGEQRAEAPKPIPAPTAPAVVAPVGGLSRAEMDNAIAIVDVAKRENLPKRAAIVALATALQESHLRNLANPNVPASLGRPNEGVGYDYDSVGLFQQRPNWGSVDQLMDPHESARRFYSALTRIPGWGDYAVTVAAQMVQGSAFPDAYAKWENLATQIADATM